MASLSTQTLLPKSAIGFMCGSYPNQRGLSIRFRRKCRPIAVLGPMRVGFSLTGFLIYYKKLNFCDRSNNVEGDRVDEKDSTLFLYDVLFRMVFGLSGFGPGNNQGGYHSAADRLTGQVR
jgi:hypothetical protein